MHVYFFLSQGYDHDFTVHFFKKTKKPMTESLIFFLLLRTE
jgi:hypothetical protein